MPGRRLIAAVYVKDPSTREELILLPGESPAPEIAALVTNPDAWDTPRGEVATAEPRPVAVGEPDPTAGTAEAAQEQGEAGGVGAKKTPSRRTRSSAS
ncbi:hypothetical protein [Streptomyces sp. ME19-01-6]|uniref:hypothetical protein n=1 Tax=Streptomyces sp. ME19-01-6 TaxID=3028686 RepID=UPI0029BA5705|nr:hypothetical protein [Streptomyces sp. ME19-01-6]MDX3224545.1 hypothetical protein [Streptomyces sp. ME19-01-6]